MIKTDATKLQGTLAVLSFSSGVIIASVCLFFIDPLGEIAASAISIVSELLVLCGALLGTKLVFDTKLHNFRADIEEHIENKINGNRNENVDARG